MALIMARVGLSVIQQVGMSFSARYSSDLLDAQQPNPCPAIRLQQSCISFALTEYSYRQSWSIKQTISKSTNVGANTHEV